MDEFTYSVLIKEVRGEEVGETVGDITVAEDSIKEGDVVTVTLYDENGRKIEATGEILHFL